VRSAAVIQQPTINLEFAWSSADPGRREIPHNS
jgi:hypothetical protein